MVLALAFAGVCAFVFSFVYSSARNNTIAQLNAEQRLHTRQVAQGIEDFFVTWTSSLEALARMDAVKYGK